MFERTAERRLWRALFALLTVATSAWALGTPVLTGHDEADQAVRSSAAARGDLLGTPLIEKKTSLPEIPSPGFRRALAFVRVPVTFADGRRFANCFLGIPHARFPGAPLPPHLRRPCPNLEEGSRLASTFTDQHRNPPLYSIALGIPSLLSSGQRGVYLMRLVGAIACAALLASALVTVTRFARPRLATVLAFAALTPEVLYVAGTLNTAGLEAAAALCLWTAGLALALGPADPDTALVRRAGVALVALCVARPLSPVFAVVTLAVMLVLAEPGRRRSLARRADVRRWLLLGAAALTTTVAWIVLVQVRTPQLSHQASGLMHAIGLVPWWLRGVVGVFGSTDVQPPYGLAILWGAIAVVAVVVSLRSARRRGAIVVGALTVAGIGLLVSGDGLAVPNTGFFWQGRYVLPLLTGALLTAAAVARPPRGGAFGKVRDATWGPPLLAAVVVLQGWAWLYAARHYAVGYGGTIVPWRFLVHAVWSPPYGPAAIWALLYVGALAGASALLWAGASAAAVRLDRLGDEADEQVEPIALITTEDRR